jgi:NTE family protein
VRQLYPPVQLFAAALVVVVAGCAHFPVNPPLERWVPVTRGPSPLRSQEMILILAFSGGGTRAAALAYGVLEELAATEIDLGSGPRRLLDEVDAISSVSGGSFPAAYYGLFGDRIFQDFEERFLKRNVQRELVWRILRPWSWPSLFSTDWSRSDVAAELYDQTIFEGATFGDLAARSGPEILINATDLVRGNRFTFSQLQLDFLCSDLSRFSLARAVAASSAVPGILTPIRLENHSGNCGFEAPAWIEEALELRGTSRRRRMQAEIAASYLDAKRRRYVHLVDGAISDNLGIRILVERVIEEGGLDHTLERIGYDRIRKIVLILVNAQTEPELDLDRDSIVPGLAFMMGLTTAIQIRHSNFETIEFVRASFENWADNLSTPEKPLSFQMVEVGFDGITDPDERRYLNELPTSFSLDAEDVDRLIEAGRRLLRESHDFQKALERLPSGAK